MSVVTAKLSLKYQGRTVLGFPMTRSIGTAGQLIQHDDDYDSNTSGNQINVLIGSHSYLGVFLRFFGPRGRLGIMDANAGSAMPVIHSGATVVVMGAASQACSNAAYLELTEDGVLHVQGMTVMV